MKIIPLPINTKLTGIIFPTLIYIGKSIYLIDCGYEDSFDHLSVKLSQLKVEIEDIKAIIITHDDIDHLGGLMKFKIKYPSIKIYCGRLEAESVSGKIKSERLLQAESYLLNIKDERWNDAHFFVQLLMNIKRFETDRLLEDGEFIDDEIMVIHTPGHTKGHISLYIKSLSTLIAGDALIIENNLFNIANPQYTLDLPSAIISIEKIYALKPQKIICYHGGVLEKNVSHKLRSLIKQYNY
jgi:glyoxylase-like metal-dependent hydrolase (beta-lactamase superfamily II)